MRFEQLLTRSTQAFWAASYSFGLKLFDQYLLRRLSQDRLNAVVLADHDKVADVWEHLPDGEHYLAKQVGRRYLLRGVQAPGGGAFHPKTYLFANRDTSTLVVGSGNLTRDGIDRGREVFTLFSSGVEDDLPTMRAWASWVSRLVVRTDDGLLAERWDALRDLCPWMLGPTSGSSLLANDESPILDQLADRLPDSIEELHVAAPFFDQDARALRALIDACAPNRLILYVGAGTNVRGPSLRNVVDAVADVRVRRFEPRTFVHAKLIGAISSEDEGALLVGSPNLSRAALTLSGTVGAGGNSEVAVVRRGSGDRIRRVFESSGLELVDEPLDFLDDLEFEDDHPTSRHALALRTAQWREDGRVAVEWSRAQAPGPDVRLTWNEGGESAPLDPLGVTTDALNERDPLPLIVWLLTPDGAAMSNRVVVDDPRALRRALEGGREKRGTRPREMIGLDAVPLVRLVLWANERFIFDLDDTNAARRAQDAAAEETTSEDTTGFWDRYAREELRYDSRSATYRPLTPGSAGRGGPVDELIRELEMLLHGAPDQPHPVLKVLTAVPGTGEDESPRSPRTGTPWTMEARQRVRTYHLLTRWANAVADPRHALVSPAAPVVNYETLLCVITLAWLHDALDRGQLRTLLLTLLRAFIGVTADQGYLGRISQDERGEALQQLDPVSAGVAAGLAGAALESGWRHDIYDWQPVLRRGVELGVVLPDEWSDLLVAHIAPALTGELDGFLDRRMSWLDDETWAERLASELGLNDVRLDLRRRATVKAGIHVRGVSDPLRDPRLLTVARRAIDFKRLPAVAVICGDHDVIIFEPGRPARARVNGRTSRSRRPVSGRRVRQIEAQGGSWADVLGVDERIAA